MLPTSITETSTLIDHIYYPEGINEYKDLHIAIVDILE